MFCFIAMTSLDLLLKWYHNILNKKNSTIWVNKWVFQIDKSLRWLFNVADFLSFERNKHLFELLDELLWASSDLNSPVYLK